MNGSSREVGVTGEHVKGHGTYAAAKLVDLRRRKINESQSQGPAAQAVTVKLMEMLESEDGSKTNSSFQLF